MRSRAPLQPSQVDAGALTTTSSTSRFLQQTTFRGACEVAELDGSTGASQTFLSHASLPPPSSLLPLLAAVSLAAAWLTVDEAARLLPCGARARRAHPATALIACTATAVLLICHLLGRSTVVPLCRRPWGVVCGNPMHAC